MRFDPKTEKEIRSMNLLDEGIYDFEVTKSENRVSKKSGRDLIKLTLSVWDNQGRRYTIFDNLIDTMPYKLRRFCVITGLINRYNSGLLVDIDCVGKCGKVKIGIQQGDLKPDGDYYPDKNIVKDYLNKEELPFTDDLIF